MHTGITDVALLDASAYDLYTARSASVHVESPLMGLFSPRAWLSYSVFLALKSALLVGGRLGKTVSRLSAPLRERGGSTGGLAYALSATAALATAPLQGTSIGVRKGAAIATAHDVCSLGADGMASRLLLTIPHHKVRSGSHDSAVASHRLWLVSAELGTAAPDAAAQRLVAWMTATARAPPSLSAVILVGHGLQTRPALQEWGATPLGADAAALCRAAAGVTVTARGGDVAAPHCGELHRLEMDLAGGQEATPPTPPSA